MFYIIIDVIIALRKFQNTTFVGVTESAGVFRIQHRYTKGTIGPETPARVIDSWGHARVLVVECAIPLV